MTDHLTESQLQLYLTGLSPTELLMADEHLSRCPDCRAHLQTLRDFAPSVAGLRTALSVETEWAHLEWEELSAYAANRLNEVEREIVESHLAICSTCQHEYEDLSAFASHLTSFPQQEFAPPAPPTTWQKIRAFWERQTAAPPFAPLKLAGALAAIALLLWFGMQWWRGRTVPVNQSDIAVNSTPAPSTPPSVTPLPSPTDFPTNIRAVLESGAATIRLDINGKFSGIENLSAAEEKSLREAMQNGKVELPETLNQLRTGADNLMGKSNDESFRLLSPIGKVITNPRPSLRWQALPNASSYIVTIADSAGGFSVSSPPLTTTQWTPPNALPRGKTFVWQVSATKDGNEIKAPASDAPETRFRVLEQSGAAEIAKAEKAHARNPLLLGLAYARNGLVAEAEAQFQILLQQNHNSLKVRQLLQAVRAAKK